MDYAALAAELADPLYANLSDADAAALLAEQTVQVLRNVPIAEVEAYLRRRGLVYGLTTWLASDPPPSAGKAATFELVNMIASPRLVEFETISPTQYATLDQMLSEIVAAGAGLSEGDRTALLGLAYVAAPKWPDVTARDVWIARGQPS